MESRQIGRSPLQVSPLCLGGNVFGWTVDEATGFRLLDAWVDHGFNFVDTADVYSRWVKGHGGGESESMIGKWFRASGKRNRMVLATKVGKDMGDGKVGLKAKYIAQAVDDSLRRLKTDHIDLYQSHDDDANTPMQETLEAYAALIKAGKVRAIGASNHSAPRLAKALETSGRLGLPRYESLQPLYNLCDRKVYEEALEPLCLKEGVGVINFYALAMGFLTGKYRSPEDAHKGSRGKRAVEQYLTPRGKRILAALDDIAGQLKATPGQVALAWQIARPSITAPIASATSMAQMQELIGAAQLKLDAEAVRLLDEASSEEKVPL